MNRVVAEKDKRQLCLRLKKSFVEGVVFLFLYTLA